MLTMPTKLNECNYRQCAITAKALLYAQGLWKYISGEMGVPRPPNVTISGAWTTPTACDHQDTDHDLLPDLTDTSYLNQFYHFLHDWKRWQMNNYNAYRQHTALMESTLQIRYRDLTELKQLWDRIKANFEKVIKLDGQYEMAKLTSYQLKSYPSFTEWISAQDQIIKDLAICNIMIKDS